MKRKATIGLLSAVIGFSMVATVTGAISWFAPTASIDNSTAPIEGVTEGAYFAYGDGSDGNPYGISKPRHLYNLAWLTYLGYFKTDQFHFELANDINMSGWVLPPIGTTKYPFIGEFDGKDFIVSNSTISNQFSDYGTKHPGTVTSDNFAAVDCNIVGFFGVVGNYPGNSNTATYVSSTNTLSDFGLTEVTVKTYAANTLIGMVAGYSNADITNVAVDTGNVNVAAGAGTSVISPATKVSEHGIIGYTTKTKDIRRVDETIYAVNVQQKNTDQEYLEFNATEQGDTTGWGGSIDMMSVMKRLQSIRNNSSSVSFDFKRTYDYHENEQGGYDKDTTYTADATMSASASNKTYIINNNDEHGHFNIICDSGYEADYALLGGGHYETSKYYDKANHTGYRVTDGNGHYLSVSSFTANSGTIVNTTESNACVWAVPTGATGRISTQYYYNPDGAVATYYLYVNYNNQLALTTTANNATTFTRETATVDGQTLIRYSYNGRYLNFNGTSWVMTAIPTDPSYPADPETLKPTMPTAPTTVEPELSDYPLLDSSSYDTGNASYQIAYTSNGTTYYLAPTSGGSYSATTIPATNNWRFEYRASRNGTWQEGRPTTTSYPNNYNNVRIYTVINNTHYYVSLTRSGWYNNYTYTLSLTTTSTDLRGRANGGGYNFRNSDGNTYLSFNTGSNSFRAYSSGTTVNIILTSTAISNYNQPFIDQFNNDHTDWQQEWDDYDDAMEQYTVDQAAYEHYRDVEYAELLQEYEALHAIYMATYNIKPTSQITVVGTDEYLANTKTGMNYDEEDVTYFPLSTVDGYSDLRPADHNTAYVVAGSDITASTTTSNYSDVLTRVRFGRFKISGNISNDYSNGTFSHVYTVNSSMQREEITNNASYEKLPDAKKSLGSVLKKDGTYVYGLHFMDAAISMDALTTAEYVRVNKTEYRNYELPVNSINFHLKEFGYINFMAGTYYSNDSYDRNDSFFALYQVERLDSNPQKINRIFEILNIYKHSSGAKNYSYVYQLKDIVAGTTLYTKPYKVVDVAGNREWLYDDSTPYSNNQYVNTLPSNYSLAFNCNRIKKNTISETNFDMHAFYFEIPMNDGEFCLGSVSGATGSYLMYLDIGANAAKTQRTIISEHFTYDEKTFAYPVGVAFLPYNDEGIDDTNSVSMTIPKGFAGKTLTVSRSTDTITITENGTATLMGDLTYLGDSITITPNIKAKLKPKSTTTKDVKRVQYYDYNVNLEKVTKTIITDTYLNGAVTPTRVIEQYGLEADGETWTAISEEDRRVFQTENGTAYDPAVLADPTSLPLNGAMGSGGIGWVDPGSTVLLSFYYTMAEGVSTTESLTLNMAIDTNVLDGQYYKFGDYAFLITVTGGTITVKVLAKGTGTITINDTPVTAVDQTITVSASQASSS